MDNLDNLTLEELKNKIREKRVLTNEKQRNNYLKRSQDGRNKQIVPLELQKKTGPKIGTVRKLKAVILN
jgi:hypothetical protein